VHPTPDRGAGAALLDAAFAEGFDGLIAKAHNDGHWDL